MNSKAEARRRAVLEALTRATEPLIAARAKENQKVRKGNQPGATCQKSDRLIDTKKELAALAGNLYIEVYTPYILYRVENPVIFSCQ